MKTLIIAGIFAATSTAALAQSFAFQQQIGAEEYVHGQNTAHLSFAPVERHNTLSSLTRWTLDANVDGIAMNPFEGEIVKSGPSRISLYEFVRDSPEGTAYRSYHERYPVGTDWGQVARDYRDDPMNHGLAAETNPHAGES